MNRSVFLAATDLATIRPRMPLVTILVLGICFSPGCEKKPVPINPAQTLSTNEPKPDRSPNSSSPLAPANGATNSLGAMDREAVISRSESLAESGELAKASELLRQLLVADPGDIETLFRFASIQATQGNLDEAISLLDSIPADHPDAGLAALGQAADWCFQVQRYQDAEVRFEKLLRVAPDAALARRQLAYLFNRQGRRHEAAEQIRHLCRLGDVSEEELHALMSISDGVFDDPQSATDLPEGRLPYIPIGLPGQARVAFTRQQYREAAELLRQAITAEPAPESVNAFYGRAIAEAQEEAWFLQWLAETNESTRKYAEYWAGLGTYLIENQRFDEAARALGEALLRDPTDARSYRRMNQALVALGNEAEAKALFDRYVNLRDVTLASNEVATHGASQLSVFDTIIGGLKKLDRPLEAILWRSVQAFYQQAPRAQFEVLNRERLATIQSGKSFAGDNEILCGLDLDAYQLPKIEPLLANRKPITNTPLASAPLPTPIFENIAAEIGLTHHFRVASKPQANRFAIYQSLGGGVAVLDYDLDGFPDLYFAQGGSDPPKYLSDESNVLYRSIDERLQDVTAPAQTGEYRYTIGVSVGDWNQDGFPDLVAANLGRNTLFVNRGDGTFAALPTDSLDDVTLMRSSIAMADVTGDNLPDLIELNYAHDATLPKQPEVNAKGEVLVVGPLDFKPGADRILANDGAGGRVIKSLGDASAAATGLGLIITNFDNESGNEIFIGNDMAPDRLWKRNAERDWGDLAPTAGCALGSSGATNASMGIAAADFDDSGTLDLHITNFENQSATFFLNRNGTFQDRAVQFRLARDSYPVLGFGCQPLDYNLDGLLDLVVTNGHVDDTGIAGQRFKQPPQLFANRGDYFELAKVEDASGYFGSEHVGRALARLDFDQDGRSDFVVTHMEVESALLVNRTETKHHWLELKLVGTSCERDAIGARVQLRVGDQQRTQCVIAGDGYLCHNESGLSFGLGDALQASAIEITWPNGEQQSVGQLAADQHVLIVQGEADPFILRRSERRAR